MTAKQRPLVMTIAQILIEFRWNVASDRTLPNSGDLAVVNNRTPLIRECEIWPIHDFSADHEFHTEPAKSLKIGHLR
jgi:hypothetical protein